MTYLERLIESFAHLPGIGKKSAARIVYWLLETDKSFIEHLAADMLEMRERVVHCRECGNYSEAPICPICESSDRDRQKMCIVEQSRDVATIESTGEYRGLYHVLHGVLSPLDGMGPEELGMAKLKARLHRENVTEVIVATNPTLEGDSTALYIVRMLSESGISVSRIASGLPVGGDMEYADKLSVIRSLRARQNLEE